MDEYVWLKRASAAAQSVLDSYRWGDDLEIPAFLLRSYKAPAPGYVPDLTRMRHEA